MNVVQKFNYNETQRTPILYETYINKGITEPSNITDQIIDLKDSIYSNLDKKYISVEDKLNHLISKLDSLMEICINVNDKVVFLEKKCNKIADDVQSVENKLSQYDIDDDQKSEDTDDGLTDFSQDNILEKKELSDTST